MNRFGEVLTAKLEERGVGSVEALVEKMGDNAPAHVTADYLREQMTSTDWTRVPDAQMIGAVAVALGMDEEEAIGLLYVYVMDEEFTASSG